MAYKLAEAFDVLLFRIYSHYTTTDAVDPFEETDVAHFVKEDDISPYVAKKALERLGSEGYVGWLEETDTYELSVSGILFVEEQLDDPTSFIATVANGSSADADASTSIGKPPKQTGLRRLCEQLLIALYRRAEKEGFGKVFDLKEIADSGGLTYRPGEIDLCARSLDDSGLVREAFSMGDTDEGNDAAISPDGVEEAQELIRFEPEDALLSSVAPASDRVVPLDHNSAPYQETVESVDKVIEELKKDQRFDNERGQERHVLLRVIEGSRRLLDDTRMNVEIGVKLLLEPLILVAKKYTQVLLGALAGKAVDLVSKLLGLG